MKEGEGMCNAVVEAFAVAKRSLQELKKSKPRAKGCSFATLRINWPPPKLKSPHLRRNLRRLRRQVERAQDQDEQDGYDVGVTKTEEALRAKVSGVCRTYCSQMWYETLNQAGVKASSLLRKTENVYYPLPSDSLFPLV